MLIISNYSNYLTVSYRDKDSLFEKSISLDPSILDKSTIKNPENYKIELLNILKEIPGGKYQFTPTIFLLDPSKVNYKFIKNIKENPTQLAIEQTLRELNLNEHKVYYSLQKRTPLFSQFVTVDAREFDIIGNLASELNLNLKGIYSYLSLVSKFADKGGNLVLVSSYLGEIVLYLFELGGIYFNQAYGSFKEIENIKKLVENLKEFKLSGRADKFLSFNFENPSISEKMHIKEIVLNSEFGYSNPIHSLADEALSSDEGELSKSNFNLLNITDNIKKVNSKSGKSPAVLKYVSITISMVLISLLGYYFYTVDKEAISSVLSGTSSTDTNDTPQENIINTLPMMGLKVESSSSEPSNSNPLDNLDNINLNAPTNTSNLDKSKLLVRVLNSTGTPGLASRNAEILTSLGYKNVKTGNSNEEVSGNIIRVKESLKDYKEAFYKELVSLKDLKFEINPDNNASDDIIVILGN